MHYGASRYPLFFLMHYKPYRILVYITTVASQRYAMQKIQGYCEEQEIPALIVCIFQRNMLVMSSVSSSVRYYIHNTPLPHQLLWIRLVGGVTQTQTHACSGIRCLWSLLSLWLTKIGRSFFLFFSYWLTFFSINLSHKSLLNDTPLSRSLTLYSNTPLRFWWWNLQLYATD